MNSNCNQTAQTESARADSVQRLVRHWADLAALPESETHRLEIDVANCNGWIKDKRDPDAMGYYLSTHTFYGSKHQYSTDLLRRCGWNVTCANWDMPNSDSPAHVAKGDKHGECNRTVCRNPNALWFNKSTRKYYCQPCAFKIMSWPENAGLLVKEAPENAPHERGRT